jgi:protein phosphatase 2C family protein 2/3
VDFVRLKISEGKELTELSEMICDYCLAPDTSQGLDKGTDNMTFLVVAILGGRTKKEWHSWITDRVKGNYGYETPTASPQIYSEQRLRSFKARQEMREARAAREAMEGQAAVVERRAPETQKSNVQESYEEMDRARTPTIREAQAAKEAIEGQGAIVERRAPETQKSNVQESYEEMDRARTPTIPDSDDSAGDLTPKLSPININQ